MDKQTKLQKYLKKHKRIGKTKQLHQRFSLFHRFKIPAVITFGMILMIIIFLPALIVMIPDNSDQSVESVEVMGDPIQESEDLELSSLNVEVDRSESGEQEQVPLEMYVSSVVASEMPATFEEEALKAQAIAARTYVVNHMNHQEGEDKKISDATGDQVYMNKEELKQKWGKEFHWKMEKVTEAVEDTHNEIITYDQEPITPTFFSMSNGYTENAEDYWGDELPYLKSVESKWEESNPKFTEQEIFNTEELGDKIGVALSQYTDIPIEISRTSSNRVDQISINNELFSGKELREKLGLRSNDFTIKQKDDHFIFTTKGFGHGVGMSQYGANGMAEEGKNYKEIIKHYYQGVKLQTINEAVPALVSK